jgi:hypothetical protein
VIVYGPPTGIALVLTGLFVKFPGLPVNGPIAADAVLAVTVPVPDGTTPDPALSLPETLIVAWPKGIVCEAVRMVNEGVAFCTVNVKLCVASGETPLVALIVIV